MRRLTVAHDLNQVARKDAFLRSHPGSRIYALSHAGPWQADVPEESGSTVLTRYSLPELMDKLDEVFPSAGDG